MKTLFINKLAPAFKDYVLSQEPDLLNTATNTARAMWKRKNPNGGEMPKVQKLTLSLITSEIENTLQNLPEDIRDDCIMAIKNKRNNQYHNNYQGNHSGHSNQNSGNYNQNSGNGFRVKKVSVRPSVRASLRP
jgi:hypothetical protein